MKVDKKCPGSVSYLQVSLSNNCFQITEKRKKLKKEGKKDTTIDEDDPEKYKRAIQVQTMKLFADMERKRKELEVWSMYHVLYYFVE